MTRRTSSSGTTVVSLAAWQHEKTDQPGLSRTEDRLLRAAMVIGTDRNPDPQDHAYMARQLVQVTLPHRNPGSQEVWKRTNGNISLIIRPGWDHAKDRSYGYPFGSIPRLLLFWVTTEALRTRKRRLYLGETLAGFMRSLGLDPCRGGPRSDAARLRNQMNRLFRATISVDQRTSDGRRQVNRWLDMQVANRGELWWDPISLDQVALFKSWIELSEPFYEAILSAPVPVDRRALRALKHSPLALDLYAWCTYRTFRATRANETVFVPWRGLYYQLGGNYAKPKDFKRYAKAALRKVQTVYPDLHLDEVDGGINIHPSRPAILPLR